MKERRAALIALVILAGAALLVAALLGEAAREALAGPLLAAAARVDLLLRAVPQSVLWALFIGLAVLVAAATLLRGASLPARAAGPRPRYDGRVEQLAYWVEQAGEGRYFRRRLLQQMVGLSLAARGREPLPDLASLQGVLQANELDLPPGAHAYLAEGFGALTYRDPGSTPRRGEAVRARLKQLARRQRAAPPDPRLEQLVAHLEYLLEIPNDGTDPR